MRKGLAAVRAVPRRAPWTSWPRPGLAPCEEGDDRPEGAEGGGAEVDPRGVGAGGLVRMAGEVEVAAHRLGEAVEAELAPVGAGGPEAGVGDEDDVGSDLAEGLEVEPELPERALGHVGDHDVRRRDEPALDLAPFVRRRIKGQALLVAIDLEVRDPGVVRLAHPVDEAVLPASGLLHPDDLRSEVAEQCRAPRPRDVAPEVENPYPFQHSRHRLPLSACTPVHRRPAPPRPRPTRTGGGIVPERRGRTRARLRDPLATSVPGANGLSGAVARELSGSKVALARRPGGGSLPPRLVQPAAEGTRLGPATLAGTPGPGVGENGVRVGFPVRWREPGEEPENPLSPHFRALTTGSKVALVRRPAAGPFLRGSCTTRCGRVRHRHRRNYGRRRRGGRARPSVRLRRFPKKMTMAPTSTKTSTASA